MTCPIWPANPTVGQTVQRGTVTYQWTGVVWDSITGPLTASQITELDERVVEVMLAETNVNIYITNYGALPGLENAEVTKLAFDAAYAQVVARGGGTIHVGPYADTSASYWVDTQVDIANDNVVVELHNDLRLAWSDGTDPKSCLRFAGTATNYLVGCGIKGNGRVLFGNGTEQNNNGYVYGVGEGFACATFVYCDYPFISKTHCNNGLVSCGKFLRCSNPLAIDSKFNTALHDNGLSISRDPEGFVETNRATWNNGRVKSCILINNEDFGGTAFDAHGTVWEDCTSVFNGTDSSPHGDGKMYHAGGGYSSEAQVSGNKLYTKYIRCLAESNMSNGFFTTSDFDEYLHCTAENTNLNESVPVINQWRGNGISSLSGTTKVTGGRYARNAREGIFGFPADLDETGTYSAIRLLVEGNTEITLNARRAIFARGVLECKVSEEVTIKNNQTGGAQQAEVVVASVGTEFDGQGTCIVRGSVESNVGALVRVVGISKADVSYLRGAVSTAAIPISVDSCDTVITCGNSVTGQAGSLPLLLVNVSGTVGDHFAWGNYGEHTGGSSVGSTATSRHGMTQPQNDVSGWTDSSAQADFNTLLLRLRNAGVLGE